MADNDLHFFFLGTDHHRDTRKDALTSYYHYAKSKNLNSDGKNLNCRLFDGVGSKPTVSSDHPTPGTYLYDPVTDTKVPCSRGIMNALSNLFHRIFGLIFGAGMSGLMYEALRYIQHIEQSNPDNLPKTINLYGFSRGADACMRLANLLSYIFPNLEVNLFLIDQVPGPQGGKDVSSYTVTGNVKLFHVTIMSDEKRPFFEAQDVQTYHVINPFETKMTIRSYPGHHESAMNLHVNPNLQAVPTLLHDDMSLFAEEIGLLDPKDELPHYIKLLKPGKYEELPAVRLSRHERFMAYADIQKNRSQYDSGKFDWYRRARKYQDYYSPLPRLFVNKEHALLMESFYPDLYKALLSNDPNIIKSLGSELDALGELTPAQSDLKQIMETDGLSFFHNRIKSYIKKHNTEKIHIPRQYLPAIENQIPINNAQNYWIYQAYSTVNYATHHLKLNRIERQLLNKLVENLEKASKYTLPEEHQKFIQEQIFITTTSLLKKKQDKRQLYKQLGDIARYNIQPKPVVNEHATGEKTDPRWVTHNRPMINAVVYEMILDLDKYIKSQKFWMSVRSLFSSSSENADRAKLDIAIKLIKNLQELPLSDNHYVPITIYNVIHGAQRLSALSTLAKCTRRFQKDELDNIIEKGMQKLTQFNKVRYQFFSKPVEETPELDDTLVYGI